MTINDTKCIDFLRQQYGTQILHLFVRIFSMLKMHYWSIIIVVHLIISPSGHNRKILSLAVSSNNVLLNVKKRLWQRITHSTASCISSLHLSSHLFQSLGISRRGIHIRYFHLGCQYPPAVFFTSSHPRDLIKDPSIWSSSP